jgi:predicted TIM-barrel fold metal-dependent hydrolase
VTLPATTNAGTITLVIIDCHTHIFPPEIRDDRDAYVSRDPTFAEMYADPKSKIATAEDLLGSMDEAGVDVSVASGFAWQRHDDVVRHNDYLLESAAKSNARLVPFCTVNLAHDSASDEIARCAAAGARGIGELRPENQGWELNGGAGNLLATLTQQHNLVLLFHVTEPGGHEYPGKHGLQLGAFYRFQMDHQDITIIGGHLGGGLPLHAPPAQAASIVSHVAFDTAAQPYLYDDNIFAQLAAGPFRQRIVMGSDYPLISQKRQIEVIRRSLPESDADLVLGANATQILGIHVGPTTG